MLGKLLLTYAAPKRDVVVCHESCVGSLPDGNQVDFGKIGVRSVDYEQLIGVRYTDGNSDQKSDLGWAGFGN